MKRLRSNDACWCGSRRKLKRCHGDYPRRHPVTAGRVVPPRSVPAGIIVPEYVAGGQPSTPPTVQIITGADLDRLRLASQVAADVLTAAGALVAPGVTTDELDEAAHETYLKAGAYPSTLHYKGYMKSICTSVNEVICHGIPDSRPLQEGDIVNVDVTAYIEGMHGDTSATFLVGAVDTPTRTLVELTREALHRGIAALAPGLDIGVIGEAIQPFAHAHGLGVIREYGGHGIGTIFHAAPHVNHTIERERPFRLEPGMTFTVEPMLTAGTTEFHTWSDEWTVVTNDQLPSAQFEHTVIISDTGAEILTLTSAGTSPAGTQRSLTGSR